jgi:hypothetical protein
VPELVLVEPATGSVPRAEDRESGPERRLFVSSHGQDETTGVAKFHVDTGALAQVGSDRRKASQARGTELGKGVIGRSAAGKSQQPGVGDGGLAADRGTLEDANAPPATLNELGSDRAADDPAADDDDRGRLRHARLPSPLIVPHRGVRGNRSTRRERAVDRPVESRQLG